MPIPAARLMTSRRLALLAFLVALVLTAAVPAAEARFGHHKGIWGPVRVDGVSQFPIYKELGAAYYNTSLHWGNTASERPADPRNPSDPAYRWPAELDDAVAEAARHGMSVALTVQRSPQWANGSKPDNWAPKRARDYADFVVAASRRYPRVRRWIIWGEPTRAPNFQPLNGVHPTRRLARRDRRPQRLYAQLLDAAYGALKRESSRNVVIGGNSYNAGDISPFNWIRYLRLPNGKRPRMDLYGHNPFTLRRPRLSRPLYAPGYADFSDLDTLMGWIDRYLGRDPLGKRMRLWLGEWTVPTDNFNHEFGGYVTRPTQALWTQDVLRIVRRSPRLTTLNWFALYDEVPRPNGDETHRGLIDLQGRRKPAFRAFRRG